ncbi:hypothetical protein LLB_0714 [Legionella longbeachae D-4968]|nr:hypothetical protein LLB_0714 [Legionella longbeachae D-4968]
MPYSLPPFLFKLKYRVIFLIESLEKEIHMKLSKNLFIIGFIAALVNFFSVPIVLQLQKMSNKLKLHPMK